MPYSDTHLKGIIMIKTYYDQVITALLEARPGHCHVSPDGLTLHALGPDGIIVEFTGPNFKELSEEEVNDYIVAQLKAYK
jgi:hypothetical protein